VDEGIGRGVGADGDKDDGTGEEGGVTAPCAGQRGGFL
jgi:hypothetical protein